MNPETHDCAKSGHRVVNRECVVCELSEAEIAASERCTAQHEGYACIRWQGHGGGHMYAPAGLTVEKGIEGFVQCLKNEARQAAANEAKERE